MSLSKKLFCNFNNDQNLYLHFWQISHPPDVANRTNVLNNLEKWYTKFAKLRKSVILKTCSEEISARPQKLVLSKKSNHLKMAEKKFYFGHSSSGKTMFFPTRREEKLKFLKRRRVAFSRNFFIAIKIVCCLKLTNFCLLLLRKPKTIEFSRTHWAK